MKHNKTEKPLNGKGGNIDETVFFAEKMYTIKDAIRLRCLGSK